MPKSFEELPVWQKARKLADSIYALTRNQAFAADFSLIDQIRRAAISVMSNIAEGFERGSNTEFIQFLYIAKGSAGETRAQLYVAFDQEYIAKAEFDRASALCNDVSAQLSGLIKYLKSSQLKGEKFRREYKSMREEAEELSRQFKIQNSRFKKEEQDSS